MLKMDKKDKVLDVGCGTGLFFRHLPKGSKGIDPSEGLLKQVPKKFKRMAKKASAESIPYPDNSFDVVVSVTALQNAKNPEKAVMEMKRVGKGKFGISFPKRSPKRKLLEAILKKEFPAGKLVEEDKDLMLIANI